MNRLGRYLARALTVLMVLGVLICYWYAGVRLMDHELRLARVEVAQTLPDSLAVVSVTVIPDQHGGGVVTRVANTRTKWYQKWAEKHGGGK